MSITYQKITKEVRIAGQVVRNVLSVESSAGFEQINAEATIYVVTRPSWVDEGQTVTIWGKNTGTGQGQIFGGEVVSIDWTYAPTKVGIVCRDLLARTREEWGGDDYEYTNQTSDAVVRNALEKKAIPSSVARIEGSGWTVGVINPLELKSGDDVYGTLIEPLDDAEGYKTFSLTSGTIIRQRITGAPGATPAMTFERGVQILANPSHNRTKLGIVNRVIWTGVDYQGLTVGGPGIGEASAPNPYVSDPSGYVTERKQSNLIEDDPTALLFAQQRVSDKNRRPESGEFSIPFDPRLQPGMTVKTIHPELELGSVTAFCSYVAHSLPEQGGAITTYRIKGGNLSGFSLQPPVANFAIQTILEGEDTGSGVDALLVCICDGSQSYDPDGTITGYAWAASSTGGTCTPSSGSGSIFRFVVSGAPTDVTVELTVTDNDGLTGALELVTPINQSTELIEELYLAFGDMSCSTDGEQTWRDVTPTSGSATCLAAYAPAWGQVWGTTTGHVYATFDFLQGPPVDFGQPHGAVACTALWVHELDNTRLWAGFDDGKVYYGVVDTAAFTCSFTLAGTVPDSPIVEIRESIGFTGELRATAGAGYYYSADAGASWSLQNTFDVAWRMTAGFDTNLASGLNTTPPLYDEDGSPPTVPVGVEHIRGISFGWRQQELYAADDTAALYLGPAPDFNLALHADTTPAITNHMIRSGNIDRVVYMAVGDGTGDNGFCKWIPGTTPPFFIRRTGADAGLMLGYGALRPPNDLQIELIMLGRGATGAADKIFYYSRGAGWANLAPPLAGKYWYKAAACPFNLDKWLLLGNSNNSATYSISSGVTMADGSTALWLTTDRGATFTPITLADPSISPIIITDLEWSQTDANVWYIAAQDNSTTTALWRGAGATAAAPVKDTTTTAALALIPGLAGDVYFAPSAGGGAPIKGIYVSAGDVWTVPSGSAISLNASDADYVKGTRQVVVGANNGMWTTADYRAAQPTSAVVGVGDSVAYCAGLVFVSGGGIKQISDPFTAPAATQVTNILIGQDPVRSDRQTQTRAASKIGGSTNILVYNGVSWVTLVGPADADPAKVSPYIEVMVR